MIVEHIDRAGHILETKAFDSDTIKFGRAYDNDVIVSDPYVDPHHVTLKFNTEEGVFTLSDLGTKNGCKIYSKKTHKPDSGHGQTMVSGDIFSIGKSRFKVLSSDHPVAPALSLSFLDNLHVFWGSWIVFIAASFLTIAISGFLLAYLEKPYSNELFKDAISSVYIIVVAMGYGFLWVFIARSQRHDGHFFLHCNIVLVVYLALELLLLLHPLVAFNFNPLLLDGHAGSLLNSLSLFLICYISVYQSTRLGLYRRVAVSLALPAVLYLSFVVNKLNEADFSAMPAYEITLVEPALQWHSAVSEEEFLAETLEMYSPVTEEAVERYLR